MIVSVVADEGHARIELCPLREQNQAGVEVGLVKSVLTHVTREVSTGGNEPTGPVVDRSRWRRKRVLYVEPCVPVRQEVDLRGLSDSLVDRLGPIPQESIGDRALFFWNCGADQQELRHIGADCVARAYAAEGGLKIEVGAPPPSAFGRQS